MFCASVFVHIENPKQWGYPLYHIIPIKNVQINYFHWISKHITSRNLLINLRNSRRKGFQKCPTQSSGVLITSYNCKHHCKIIECSSPMYNVIDTNICLSVRYGKCLHHTFTETTSFHGNTSIGVILYLYKLLGYSGNENNRNQTHELFKITVSRQIL